MMRFNIAYVDKRRAMDIIEKAHGHEMEARAESLLENAFRGSDMPNGAGAIPEAVKTPKAFTSITEGLTGCKEIASSLSTRSRKLVSVFTGQSEPPKETEEKKEVDSVVLTHVLQDVEAELRKSLSEISDDLEKLENAW